MIGKGLTSAATLPKNFDIEIGTALRKGRANQMSAPSKLKKEMRQRNSHAILDVV